MELLEAENGYLASGSHNYDGHNHRGQTCKGSNRHRRGPKPLSVRANFAATAWLDGDVLWRSGRVVWRVEGRETPIGSREIEAVSRALNSLRRHEKAARRHCADFDAFLARRERQLEKARHLAPIRAPDLEALASPSRRRNPAALERLVSLLAVESSVAEPLFTSPARALFAAYPLSQKPLRELIFSPNQPLEEKSIEAPALAALIIGAAQPLEAFPVEPLLRRAARYGARFGFPRAPELVVSLLKNAARDAEMSVLRVENSLESRGVLGFDAAQLLALHLAGNDAAQLAQIAETANRLPDPFPSLRFAPVAPKRFDFEAQRAISLGWNEQKSAAYASIRDVLAQIARRGNPRDLELASEVLSHLISAPISVLGAQKIERNHLPRRQVRENPPFQVGVAEAIAVALNALQDIADAPVGVLELLGEFLPTCEFCGSAENLAPAVWAQRWCDYAKYQVENGLAPLLELAQNVGVKTAREALRLNCWREWGRYPELSAETLDFLLEIKVWAPEFTIHVAQRLAYLSRFWSGGAGGGDAGARAALTPVLAALSEAESAERALWLDVFCGGIEWSRRGARCELPALAPFFSPMRRVREAGGEKIERWILVETALELWKTAPDDKSVARARFEWLASEMTRQLLAETSPVVGSNADADADANANANANNDAKGPNWSYLGELVGLLSQLAPRDDDQFRALVSASWRFAGSGTDFDWDDVRRGAKLVLNLPNLQNALANNLIRCPARCFSLLEKLGPLDRFDSLRAPLEKWRQELQAPFEGQNWREILDFGPDSCLDFDAELEILARRFATAKHELQEPQCPPSSLLKIANWPRKIEAEIAALQSRSDIASNLSPHLAPNLAARLKNLKQRLENRDELRASMRQEMGEALHAATVEAELRAAENAVEGCYRVRLEALGAPKDLALDADWLNAALFSTDIQTNRKWLREIVRASCEKRDHWRLEIPGNARFLESLQSRGFNRDEWLLEAPRRFEIGENSGENGDGNVGKNVVKNGGARFELRLESCPLRILQMGNYFDTCLSRGGCNAFSSVANAVELNKRVVFARDAKNRVVGRQLWALSNENKLLGFRIYTSVAEPHRAALEAAFGEYARDFAARCRLELGDEGEVERLFVADWYDDGTIPWSDI